jgi:hypothetical protein
MKQNTDLDEKKWLQKYSLEEVKVMNNSSNIGGINYPIWYPSSGIFK